MEKFVIKSWIPAEVSPENETVYFTRPEAVRDLNTLEHMQPENIYKIVQVEE